MLSAKWSNWTFGKVILDVLTPYRCTYIMLAKRKTNIWRKCNLSQTCCWLVIVYFPKLDLPIAQSMPRYCLSSYDILSLCCLDTLSASFQPPKQQQNYSEKFLVIYVQVHEHDHVENFRYPLIRMVCNIFRQFGTKCEAIINIAKGQHLNSK
jgi:hypothetical protein